jgi:hypothetical protein
MPLFFGSIFASIDGGRKNAIFKEFIINNIKQRGRLDE